MKKILTTLVVCLALTTFLAGGALAADKPAKSGCSPTAKCGPAAKASCGPAKVNVTKASAKATCTTTATAAPCCSPKDAKAIAAGCATTTMTAEACATKMAACPTSSEGCGIKGTEACAAVMAAATSETDKAVATTAVAKTSVKAPKGCSPKAGAACCTSAPKSTKK